MSLAPSVPPFSLAALIDTASSPSNNTERVFPEASFTFTTIFSFTFVALSKSACKFFAVLL
jgi:hypothetical protein